MPPMTTVPSACWLLALAPAATIIGATPKTKAKPDPADSPVPKKNSDWDFYHSADPQASADHLQPYAKAVNASAPAAGSASAKQPAAALKPVVQAGKASGGTDGPLIPKGSIMLQVAAVQHQDDALALAQALQQKKFPAFVIPPGSDKYFRVQVGPYPDMKVAASARQDLEAKGFKSIVKR